MKIKNNNEAHMDQNYTKAEAYFNSKF